MKRAALGFRADGVTLIELLVALVISLIGALAIMQIYVNSEAGKRATGSLLEAQGGGLVGLYNIERELQQAGLGFMHLSVMGCNITAKPSSMFNNRPLQPVTIIPAGAAVSHASNLWGIPPGDANSDMIALISGTGSSLVEGALIKQAEAPGAVTYRLSNVLSIANGDYLLLGEAGKGCTLAQVTATSISNDVDVDVGGVDAYSLDGRAMHLGSGVGMSVFAVRNGRLTRCDFMISNCADAGATNDTTVWVPVANDVVALVAQYGIDTTSPADMIADTYCKSRVPPGGVCPNPDTGLTAPGNMTQTQGQRACDWARIPLVQIALISRSGQYEKEEVSPATLKLWPDSAVAPTTIGPDWPVADRHYRYRVARSAVSMRNLIWMGAQTSCV